MVRAEFLAAKVLAPDGRWLALDARGLLADQNTLTILYHAGLRAELTSRLGVAWREPGRRPDAGQTQVALDVLPDSQSTWRLGAVVRELAFAIHTDTGLPAEQVIAAVEAGADRFAEEWLVELAPPVRDGAPVRVSDGRPVTESALDRRFSTDYILDDEHQLAGLGPAQR